MSLRIISGSLKGRRLQTPTWAGLRPTSDKLRETLFNILADRVGGARVIDGYAGTGAVGIEALSRGAREVTFIEQDRRAEALIAENLRHCGVRTGYTVLRADARQTLESFAQHGVAFDIVFLDPPYASDREAVSGVLQAAGRGLAAAGVVVLEHDRRHPAPESADPLTRFREVVSGDNRLSFYQL